MIKRILIIDDDMDVLNVMEEALGYDGFEVVIASEIDDHQTMLRDKQIDLVIIDFLLHGINGGEICYQIKHSPEFGHLPIIIYSAYPKVVASLGSYGCDAFIPKPFDLADVTSQINRLLHCSSNTMFTN